MEMDYYNWLFVFLRVSAFLLVLPFFTMANFPVTLRVALGALAALLLAPLLPPFAAGRLDFFSLLGVMFQEVSVGLLLGFVARLIFFTVEMAGSVIGTEMGLNMAAVLDPVSSQRSSAVHDPVVSGRAGDAHAESAPLDAARF